MIILKKIKKQWKLYPIGSPKGALNNKREPEYVGTVKFKKYDDSIAISRFVADYNYSDSSNLSEKLVPPQEVIKLLRSQAVFLATRDDEIEDYLKSLNIKVRHTRVCDFCAFEGNITIVNSEFSYKHNNQLICEQCAYETIKREIKLQGFDKKIFRNLKDILDKTGNLEKTLSVLSPKFDPLSNRNLTLFDRVDTKSKYKIPDVSMKRLKIPHKFRDILIKNGNKKFSIKNFFIKFDDEDDAAVNIEADNNQKLIDKFYGDKKSLDDADVEADNSKKKKPKKEKKPKEKKQKKEKKPKEKKFFSKDDMQKVSFSKILVIILLSVIICIGIVVSSKIVNYKINLNNANELYLSGNYSQAYEILNGMDIKDKDKDFYEKTRIMANLYQGISSYDNYIAIGDTTSAIISLVNAVSRKATLGDDILKYDLTDKVDNVYSKILSILNVYGINEETALDLGTTDNYSELRKKVSLYGGTVK